MHCRARPLGNDKLHIETSCSNIRAAILAVTARDPATTSNKNWLYADHLGSIIATADAAGTSTATFTYGPYGEPNQSTGTRFRYTGQQLLGQLNLYYYKARFYSPALGRFLQTDPIGYEDNLNLYAYVGNNPINMVDPMGVESVHPGTGDMKLAGLTSNIWENNPWLAPVRMAVDASKDGEYG